MTALVPLFSGIAILVAGLAWIAVWSPRRPAIKVAATLLATLVLPFGYVALIDLPGRPKPVRDEWLMARAPEAVVLAFDLDEGQAIYLWLRLPNLDEPRAYWLPWSRRLAQELQDAGQAAKRAGSELAMRAPFEPSLDDREPRFYPLPQPAPPPKGGEDPPAEIFNPPRNEGRDGHEI